MKTSQTLQEKYAPLSEPMFYILLMLEEQDDHGYSISQKVKELTGNQVTLPPGTMYGALSKMETDHLIRQIRIDNKRKIYTLEPIGKEILQQEKERIERLYRNCKGEKLS